jgi:hypothetical protein
VWLLLESKDTHDTNRVKDSVKEVEDSEASLKYRFFQWLREHPKDRKHGFLRKACTALGIDYTKNKGTLWTYSSQFKTDMRSLTDYQQHSRKLVCSSPDGQHGVFAEVVVPECLDRKRFVDVSGLALGVGWRLSRNRNHVLVWDKEQFAVGRVQWWMTGKVRIHVVKPQTLGRAKQLLYRAFISSGLIADLTISEKFLGEVRWVSNHDVYLYEKSLPYKKITTYKELGVEEIVTGDFSHRKALEVHVVKPDIVSKFEVLVETVSKAFAKSELEKAGLSKLLEQNTLAIQGFNSYLAEVSKPQSSKTQKVDRLYE